MLEIFLLYLIAAGMIVCINVAHDIQTRERGFEIESHIYVQQLAIIGALWPVWFLVIMTFAVVRAIDR